MKKVLALIMAALMIAAMAVSMVSASDDEYPELDVRDMRAYGQDNTYLGDTPIAIAPTVDGKIDANEYQKEFVISKDGDAKWEYVNNELKGDIHEYYAYDADYFYFGLVLPSNDTRNCLAFNMNAIDSPSAACYTARAQLVFYDEGTMAVGWGTLFKTGEDGETTFVTQAGHNVESRGVSINLGADATWREGELIPGGTRILLSTLSPSACTVDSKFDATTQTMTYEIKVSKVGLATTWRTGGEDAAADIDFVGIHYIFIQEYSATNYYANGNTTQVERKWYPQTTEDGENAAWVLDDAGLAGGFLVHFVHAKAEPELVIPDGGDDEGGDDAGNTPAATTAAPAATTAAPATTAAATDAPAATTAAAEKKGCKGSLTVSALALLPIVVGGVVIARKRED